MSWLFFCLIKQKPNKKKLNKKTKKKKQLQRFEPMFSKGIQ
jgi:hypothetical protein